VSIQRARRGEVLLVENKTQPRSTIRTTRQAKEASTPETIKGTRRYGGTSKPSAAPHENEKRILLYLEKESDSPSEEREDGVNSAHH